MKKREDRTEESSGKQRDAVSEARKPVIIVAVLAACLMIFVLIQQKNSPAFPAFFILTIVALSFGLIVVVSILKKIKNTIINTDDSLLYDGNDKLTGGSINFSQSRWKILRAGPANMLIPGTIIGVWFIFMAFRDLGFPLSYTITAETALLLLLGFMYISAVSRIIKRDCDIIFECPLHEVKISITDIRKFYYFKQRVNGQISFIITQKNKLLPRIFTASVVSFDTRWMDQAKEKVEDFFHDPDCSGDA